MWFDHAREIVHLLARFVTDVRLQDPQGDASRIEMTLDYVNKFLGDALGCLSRPSSMWWADFRAVSASIRSDNLQ